MKRALTGVVMAGLMVMLPATVFGWGSGTHTFYADHLGVRGGPANLHEMYGAVLSDAFNVEIDTANQFMWDQLHHEFMPLVTSAWRCELRAVAFAVGSHNDTWGVDFTAHHSSRNVPGIGYAELKGGQFAVVIEPQIVAILVAAGIPLAEAQYLAHELAPGIGHDLAELAVDLLIKRNQDPAIGCKMVLAALSRPFDTPLLLAATYARPYAEHANISVAEAARRIVRTEGEFRQQMVRYGGALMLNEAQAVQAFASMWASLAESILVQYTGRTIFVDPAIVAALIQGAMVLVSADYGPEVAATLGYVQAELVSHGLNSCSRFFAKGGEENRVASRGPVSGRYALGENYPNPFNPVTTVPFQLPEQAAVTLEVFNMLGQKIRTLAEGKMYEAGTGTEVWDGRDDNGLVVSSGTYLCRLSTPAGVLTRKMVLMK